MRLSIHVTPRIIWHAYLMCYAQNICEKSVILWSQKKKKDIWLLKQSLFTSVFFVMSVYKEASLANSSYFKLKIRSIMQTARVN